MRTSFFVSLLSLLPLLAAAALAQDQAPTPTSSDAAPTGTPDAAKIADFEKWFAQGQQLEQEGHLLEAREIFDGIIAEAPEAKGSLREAGFISIRLSDWARADGYFEKLHEIVPDYPAAIESLIQINQALKRDVKVEMLIQEFRQLYAAGKVPNPYFVREQTPLQSGDKVVILQYFDYAQPPYLVWKAQVLDAAGGVKRQLVLAYDLNGSKEIQEKDPKLADAEQFLLVEDVLEDGRIKRVDAYFQMFSLPEYQKVRNTMLAIIGGAYQPVYSQTVDVPAQ
jgi:tetratricopeptide (TPR) repeat protein